MLNKVTWHEVLLSTLLPHQPPKVGLEVDEHLRNPLLSKHLQDADFI
jgi:hypothetical protein